MMFYNNKSDDKDQIIQILKKTQWCFMIIKVMIEPT
jgi:hypothetical protein